MSSRATSTARLWKSCTAPTWVWIRIIKTSSNSAPALAGDGWGGAMIGTDLQDVMFGSPSPLQAEANLGIMKEDHVNVIVHGHEPLLSEMIVAASQSQEMI